MEHWTEGHGTAFVLTLALVYLIWTFAKLIETTKTEVELVFKFIFTGLTVILLLSFVSIASGILGMSGAIAVLFGSIVGLQMATMHAFKSAPGKKSLEAEEAAEGEEE